MTDPEQAQRYVYDTLHDHFNRTPEHVEVPEIVELTGLDEDTVQNALRRLYETRRIDGVTVAELHYPVRVTGLLG